MRLTNEIIWRVVRMTSRIPSLIFLALLSSCLAFAQADDDATIAARVGSDVILVREVRREMKQALGDRKVIGKDEEILEAQTLGLLVNRQLVLQYLTATQQGYSESEIDQSIAKLEKRLKQQQKTLAEQLAELHMSEAELRRVLAWENGWPKYLATKVVPANLEKYFDQHRREFDGTQLRVAHILLKVEKPEDPKSVDRAVEQAKVIRETVLAKKISFAEAAQKHSQAPTAKDGGEMGLISRHEPMPESFNEAAYELKVGETSEPVLTAFGVHLVHLLAEEPGKLTLADDLVNKSVREELIRYLFMWIAEKQRTTTEIQFTGALPYFDAESDELVPAKRK